MPIWRYPGWITEGLMVYSHIQDNREGFDLLRSETWPCNHCSHRSPLSCAGLKDRMNLCLFCLSLVDGMYVFSFYVASTHCLARVFRPDLETWWKWLINSYTVGIYRGSLLCSGCLTMIISVERCVCVFLPLRATSLIRTRTMAVIVFTAIATIHTICMIYPLKVQTLMSLVHDVY